MKSGQAIAAIALLLSMLLLPRRVNADSVEPITIVLAQSTAPADVGKPMIVLTITNNGDSSITLYKFRLPFNWNGPLPNNQFEVRDIQGIPQQYIGDFDHVVGASPDKFTELQPHQTLSGKVELRYSYSFDTQVVVKFKVRYSLPLGIVSEGNELDENSPDYATNPNRRRIVQSNELQITIDPTAPLDPPGNAAQAGSDLEVHRIR